MTQIEQLKAAYEAATPGEWEHHWKLQWSVRHVSKHPYISGGRSNTPLSEQDAKFIALAHNMMPLLLEAVELLEEARGGVTWVGRRDELLEKLK